ncbi:FRG domain-containing protein [Flavobacterium sp.]|uniref:FRG domain-containing protein n=1 Tax=Flavobacterium sp. TaxID=239 RepID=UPI0039E3652D
MHEMNFKNWKEFKSGLKDRVEGSHAGINLNNFLFRGQADSKWHLWSSFDRIEKNKAKYNILINNFKKICNYYNHNEELFKNDDKVIAAYAQHYGLPTRLLDWTSSPYFAAFFAFSTAKTIKTNATKCTIWGINKESESLKMKSGIEFISLPSNKFNYRMKNQIGHFTLSNHTEDSLDDFDSALIKSTKIDDLLWKLNLPVSEMDAVLADLEFMGINYSTVYPDIQGYIEESIFKSDIIK